MVVWVVLVSELDNVWELLRIFKKEEDADKYADWYSKRHSGCDISVESRIVE